MGNGGVHVANGYLEFLKSLWIKVYAVNMSYGQFGVFHAFKSTSPVLDNDCLF